jgi:hypothetical protein
LVSGWTGNVKTGTGTISLHIFVNGKLVYTAPPNVIRDDVNRAYPILSETNTGFRFKLPADPNRDIKDVRVFSMAENGILYEVFYKREHPWLKLYDAL